MPHLGLGCSSVSFMFTFRIVFNRCKLCAHYFPNYVDMTGSLQYSPKIIIHGRLSYIRRVVFTEIELIQAEDMYYFYRAI
jgi:hypothetical protein